MNKIHFYNKIYYLHLYNNLSFIWEHVVKVYMNKIHFYNKGIYLHTIIHI